jgi:hypothetical protein
LLHRWEGKIVFLTGFVEIPEVDADSNIFVFLPNRYHIGYPFGMSDREDYSGSQQFIQLSSYLTFQVGVDFPELLLDRFLVVNHGDSVLNDRSVVGLQLIVISGEDVFVLS